MQCCKHTHYSYFNVLPPSFIPRWSESCMKGPEIFFLSINMFWIEDLIKRVWVCLGRLGRQHDNNTSVILPESQNSMLLNTQLTFRPCLPSCIICPHIFIYEVCRYGARAFLSDVDAKQQGLANSRKNHCKMNHKQKHIIIQYFFLYLKTDKIQELCSHYQNVCAWFEYLNSWKLRSVWYFVVVVKIHEKI